MECKIVDIAGIKIGGQYPVCVAAEIGTYFGTDLEIAKEYIEVAKEAGVEFLKTEILHSLSIIHDDCMVHNYSTDFGTKSENYRSLLTRKKLSLKEYEKLFRYAMDKKFPIIASVYDMKGLDFLVDMGAAAAKVASQNITNRPLIEHCAKSGLPLIMDTGNALLHEVAAAVYWAETCGVPGIVINHRPDGSPCPANKQNLCLIETYNKTFKWPVGLACHYDGDEMIYLAIGLGASFIEKPLYHKKVRDDQDTLFTMHYEAFKEMVKKVRNCSNALGDGIRKVHIAEQLEMRACIVASVDIKEGVPLSFNNVVFAWPMRGISAAYWHEVAGMCASKEIKKGNTISWGDIKPRKD